jgi:hypothetical protein
MQAFLKKREMNKSESREIAFVEITIFSPFIFRDEVHIATFVSRDFITINKVLTSDKLGQNRVIYRQDYLNEEFMTTDKNFYVRVSEFVGNEHNAKGSTFLKNI